MTDRGVCTLRTLLVGALLWTFVGEAAHAHKMNVFATADGRLVSGYAYTAGGDRVQGAAIQVSTPEGERLALLETDGEGRFSFTATVKCDHVITISTADGHGATFTVAASELPDDLPLPGGDETTGATEAPGAAEIARPDPALPSIAAEPSLSSEVASLRKQIVALREQVDRFQERRSLQDIVGGVGYILGVAGIAFYVLGCRRNERAKRGTASS